MGRARAGVVLLAAICLFAPPAPAAFASRHGGSSPNAVSTSWHGLRLTLTLQQRSFPRNALVAASVSIYNGSGRTFWYSNLSWCGRPQPGVEVANGSGRLVYPPALTKLFVSPCTLPPFVDAPLAPGKTLHRTLLAILRGSWIRAVMDLHDGRGQRVTLTTPYMRVFLGVEPPPKVSIGGTQYVPMARLTPARPVAGPLWYVTSAACGAINDTAAFKTTLDWTPVHGNRIDSGCASTAHWYAVAGWLNHPVASIAYNTSGARKHTHLSAVYGPPH